jgi:hypothetical protein
MLLVEDVGGVETVVEVIRLEFDGVNVECVGFVELLVTLAVEPGSAVAFGMIVWKTDRICSN